MITIPQATHSFSYKGKIFQFNMDELNRYTNYFQINQNEIQDDKTILLKDDPNFQLSDDSINDFVNFCQGDEIQITITNVNSLHFLSHNYNVQKLYDLTTNYILSHKKELVIEYLLLNPNIDDRESEELISQNLPHYINNNQIFQLPIPILHRILSRSTNLDQDILESFLLQCLSKIGREASILFRVIDINKISSEFAEKLLTKYENIYDFNIIDKAKLQKICEQKHLQKLFDGVLSTNNPNRAIDEKEIINQLQEPDFINLLFEMINDSTKATHIQLSIILIKKFVDIGLQSIDFKTFSELLTFMIENQKNQLFYKQQADLVCKTTLISNSWKVLPDYLSMYRKHSYLVPFCVDLYLNFYYNNIEAYKQNIDIFKAVDQELFLKALQNPNQEIVSISARYVIERLNEVNNDETFQKYKDHYILIKEIAENSNNNMNPKIFFVFWKQISTLTPKYLDPFYETALKLIKLQELEPNSRMILLYIINKMLSKLPPEDFELMINLYFELLLLIKPAEFDFTGKILTNFANSNFNKTYELFKSNILTFLRDDNQETQNMGFTILSDFVKVFMTQINGDISPFIDLSLKISKNSEENFQKMAINLLNFLDYNKLSCEDIEKIFHFILNFFDGENNLTYQEFSYKIMKKIGPNPVYFDKLVEIFENVNKESLPIYFSLLVNLFTTENNLTNDKYEPLFQFVIQIFYEITQKTKQMNKLYLEKQLNDNEDFEQMEELYSCFVLRNSCSNLVLLFSIFNPFQFSELFEQSIQNLIDFPDESLLEGFDLIFFGHIETFKDFIYVYNFDKKKITEILIENDFYNSVLGQTFTDDFLPILANIDENNFLRDSLFLDYYNDFKNPLKYPDYDIIYEFHVSVFPISKFLYIDKNEDFQLDYYQTILQMFKYTKKSYEFFIELTKVIKRLAKPKRINFNTQRNPKYYKNCKEYLSQNIKSTINILLPQFEPIYYCQLFKGFCNLMQFFIYLKDDFGHDFLKGTILPFYEKYSESSEIHLLNIFTKMIENNFCNETEFDLIFKIIDIIKNRNDFYLDSKPDLLKLITTICRSAKKDKISINYFQFVIDSFKKVQYNQMLLESKINSAFCLLSLLNLNKVEFKSAILPLVPQILSVFPSIKNINEFFIEMEIFIDNNKDSFSREILDAFITAFARYLSFQSNAPSIFDFKPEFDRKLNQIFRQLLEIYKRKFKIDNIEELLNELLPDNSHLIDFILSLLN